MAPAHLLRRQVLYAKATILRDFPPKGSGAPLDAGGYEIFRPIARGGGLLIHPDLFAQTDFHLFCLRYEPLTCTESADLQFIVQQVFSKNSVAFLA